MILYNYFITAHCRSKDTKEIVFYMINVYNVYLITIQLHFYIISLLAVWRCTRIIKWQYKYYHLFSRLVADYPAVGALLPFGNEGLTYDQLLVDPRVRAHGTKVMQTVGSAVDTLNDLGSVVPRLQELATRHISYGVTKQHFSVIMPTIGCFL